MLAIPQRCKTHLWLTWNDRLLTNVSLLHRGIQNQGGCKYCASPQETTLHALRDCVRAKELWGHLGVSSSFQSFWSSDLNNWLSLNINNGRNDGWGRWNEIFGVTCWLIWRRRNEFVHQDVSPSIWEGIAEIKGIMRCMMRARPVLGKPQRVVSCQTEAVVADASRGDVHVDGSFCPRTQAAGCGGLLHSRVGEILEAFVCSVPGASSFAAEVWGCIWGLRRAWEKGYKKVMLFCDASELLDWIDTEEVDLHVDNQLLRVLRELMDRCWEVQVVLIRREENEAADALAKYALHSASGIQILSKESTQDLLSLSGIT